MQGLIPFPSKPRFYCVTNPTKGVMKLWQFSAWKRTDHVGLVLGRDGSRVYTVEGNSGDACKIKSYDLNYQCIKGYGLMNW